MPRFLILGRLTLAAVLIGSEPVMAQLALTPPRLELKLAELVRGAAVYCAVGEVTRTGAVRRSRSADEGLELAVAAVPAPACPGTTGAGED